MERICEERDELRAGGAPLIYSLMHDEQMTFLIRQVSP